MSKPTVSEEAREKRSVDQLPKSFAAILSEIERTSGALRSFERSLQEELTRALADLAVAIEDQVKEAVGAAEQATR